ncbi:TfoX/Sxy family protein [Paenibacillus filicis]|uniref:TfoX/Sxy family protein n=1 Tax=Paenibacillus gyeongsangnamensis TaxID=3388067 RepID=A0ABT4QAU9_9BACL|nr:TfoX/Sxy family protein [Paenibacillus filicis]MCZ8513958.1 TfoX/Sxy family protein [Paenibacillus filicis]
MSMPRPDDESKALFASVVPADPRVKIKPMFGSLAGFINGNMFTGLYGQEIFVRLPEEQRLQLIQEGATEFSPMPGKPMKEYVAVPDEWRNDPDKISDLIARSLSWAETLPEKVPAKKQSKKTTTK